MEIVSLDKIPLCPYDTPKDLLLLFSTAKKVEIECRKNQGMGLAASQLGLPWKLFVVWSNYPEEDQKFDYFVDCEYSPEDEQKFISIEGCLSIPNHRFQLERYNKIKVFGKKIIETDRIDLENFECFFEGVLSVVFQHEIDHNYGRERMIDKIGKRIYIS